MGGMSLTETVHERNLRSVADLLRFIDERDRSVLSNRYVNPLLPKVANDVEAAANALAAARRGIEELTAELADTKRALEEYTSVDAVLSLEDD